VKVINRYVDPIFSGTRQQSLVLGTVKLHTSERHLCNIWHSKVTNAPDITHTTEHRHNDKMFTVNN